MSLFETLAEATRPDAYLVDEKKIEGLIEHSEKIIRRNEQLKVELEDLKRKIQDVIQENKR